jgi:DNA-binding NarL/FixJ family response regulator
MILGQDPGLTVVASGTGEEAVALLRQYRPDVTVLDLQLCKTSGVNVIRALRAQDANARILVLTMCDGEQDLEPAFAAGATGYLPKDTISSELLRMIREVNRQRPSTGSAADIAKRTNVALTAREVEVIELIGRGMRNKEIAALLEIHGRTVDVHVKNVLRKLRVNDRLMAVQIARRRGLLRQF